MSRNWKLSRRINSFLLAVAPLAISACSQDSPVAPAQAASLAIAGDYARSGIVGQQLQTPLVVEVRDASGRGVRGQRVTFSVSANGGSVTSSGVSDENGRVVATWMLGTLAGGDTVTASWGNASVKFAAQAEPGTVAQLLMVSGDQAQVEAGADAALVLRAVDTYGNAIPNSALNWLSLSGGVLVTATSLTDASGLGRADLQTEPGASGVQYVVQAQSADGSVTVSFTITGM